MRVTVDNNILISDLWSPQVIRPADFVRTLQRLLPTQTGNLLTDWKIEP